MIEVWKEREDDRGVRGSEPRGRESIYERCASSSPSPEVHSGRRACLPGPSARAGGRWSAWGPRWRRPDCRGSRANPWAAAETPPWTWVPPPAPQAGSRTTARARAWELRCCRPWRRASSLAASFDGVSHGWRRLKPSPRRLMSYVLNLVALRICTSNFYIKIYNFKDKINNFICPVKLGSDIARLTKIKAPVKRGEAPLPYHLVYLTFSVVKVIIAETPSVVITTLLTLALSKKSAKNSSGDG